MCHDRDLALSAIHGGVEPILLELIKHENPMLQKFAAGALHNVCRALRHLDCALSLDPEAARAIEQRLMQYSRERQVEQDAALVLQAAMRAFVAQRRSGAVAATGAPVADAPRRQILTDASATQLRVAVDVDVFGSQYRWLERKGGGSLPRRMASKFLKGGATAAEGKENSANTRIATAGAVARSGQVVRRAMSVRAMAPQLQVLDVEPTLASGGEERI